MEIGLAVGGAFLSSGLAVLFDRLAPEGELLKMFQKHKPNLRLLQKLRMTLRGLQVVLSDAKNKQASNRHVSEWLNELHNAVDGAENLMEEINYEVLRVKLEGQFQNPAQTSKNQVSDLNLCLSDEYFLSIEEKLNDTIEKLEELEKQIGRLDLKAYLDSGKKETREPSTSLVDDSDIFGRVDEIKDLVDRLLSDENGKNLTVIPIVGMGGIGKTTLAKAVYNNENVKRHFDLKAWFCVSEPYDALAVTKGLLQEIHSFDLMADNNLNQLQIKLKESLTGKRFLVVLDDIWNEEYDKWDNLRNLFVHGAIGSKIIVTTRKENVALMMGSGAVNVGTLSSEVSWALFKRHSLDNKDPEERPELEKIGKEISQKCRGLPLALKAIGGMLRSKFKVEEWRDVLTSELWKASNHWNNILPALMLSYNDLPAHLKQCFAYCAIFPKDHPFHKEQVVHLWVANGLVQRLHSGNQYFLELISRSLFERLPKSPQGNIEKFLMHDLVNDLAHIASSKLCIRLEDNEGSHILERSRHLSYSMGDDGEFEKLKPLYKLKQLRTLLPIAPKHCLFSLSKRVLYNTLPRLTYLRALSLSHYQVFELPNFLFIKLKLLKFLDLSWTLINRLPNSICVLYNLETLLLSSCQFLVELPLQMEKLINLRHLDISGCFGLKSLLHPSKLKSIHTFLGVNFFLGGCNGLRIEDLGEVHNLYGSLSISELQHVVDGREAWKAKVREKEHVEELSLEWRGGIAESSQNERNILDELQPNRNIKKLEIKGYRGTSFPDWLAGELLLNLVALSLSNCKDCYSLPALGQLPSLKFLSVKGMDAITMLTEDFFGKSSSEKPFNFLEKLEFSMMPEWKEWHAPGIGEFPVLQELLIKDCPKLIGRLPENLSSLTELKISNCPQLILETHMQFSSVKKLEIDDCHSLTSLPFSSLPTTLKEIRICRCGKLKLEFSVSEMMYWGFLDRLELEQCDSIHDMSKELIPRARALRVADCHSLTRFVIPVGAEYLGIFKHENLERLLVPFGTQMMSLHISNCEKLKSLPEGMQELLPSLKILRLESCPEIDSFPEGGLPFNLEVLSIEYCKKLVNCRKELGLQKLSYLRDLTIRHDGSDEEIVGDENWELPCSIRRLTLVNLKTLSRQVLKSLASLEYLETRNLPQIKSLLEEGLPPSISTLTLRDHEELHSLPAEGLQFLTSLKNLHISNCNKLQCLSELPSSLSKLVIFKCLNFQTLGESVLPSSLSELDISCCLNLQTLGESVLLSSLTKLEIFNCPNLQSLPVREMPSSITYLSINICPLLEPLLEYEKGDYWPYIAHIPTLTIKYTRY